MSHTLPLLELSISRQPLFPLFHQKPYIMEEEENGKE